MCKFGVKAVDDLTMSMTWYQKRQASRGVPGFGVTSNLTGHRIQSLPCQSESGKSACGLLRLNSVGEVSSETEGMTLDQHSTTTNTNRDHNFTDMSAADKYPHCHAPEGWFRCGNSFQQAYKGGQQLYQQAQMYTMPQQSFVNPMMGAVPQQLSYPGFGGALGGAWTNQSYPQHYSNQGLVYAVMDYQPVFPGASQMWAQNFNAQAAYGKKSVPLNSRMNPNAKPFTPQSMRQGATNHCNQSHTAGKERQETQEKTCERVTSVSTDKAGSPAATLPENGEVTVTSEPASVNVKSVSESIPEQSRIAPAALTPIVPEPAPTLITQDVCTDNGEKKVQGKESTSILVCESIPRSASDSLFLCGTIINDTSPPKSSESSTTHNKGSADSHSTELNCRSDDTSQNDRKEGLSFTAVVSKELNLGRNTYILSRPRSKKKGKPSPPDRKKKKHRIDVKKSNNETKDGSAENEQKSDKPGVMTFFLSSGSSEEESEDDGIKCGLKTTLQCGQNSILISPLSCDSESDSGADSDWDEVDDISSAADFLTDQMCELLEPFMLSVLTIPNSLPKSASAPHLTNHSIQEVNKRWRAIYNSSSSNHIKADGAKHKKVHFAQDDSDRPLQTFFPIEDYCRRGPWEQYAADRCRFKTRIADVQAVIDPVLAENHRNKIFASRFDSPLGSFEDAVS